MSTFGDHLKTNNINREIIVPDGRGGSKIDSSHPSYVWLAKALDVIVQDGTSEHDLQVNIEGLMQSLFRRQFGCQGGIFVGGQMDLGKVKVANGQQYKDTRAMMIALCLSIS